MRPRDPSPGRRILLQRWKSQRASCPVPLLSWIFSSFGLDGWCMTKIEADYSTRAGCSLMIYKTGVQWCSVSDVPRGTILCFMIFMRVRRLLTAGTGLVPQYIIF